MYPSVCLNRTATETIARRRGQAQRRPVARRSARALALSACSKFVLVIPEPLLSLLPSFLPSLRPPSFPSLPRSGRRRLCHAMPSKCTLASSSSPSPVPSGLLYSRTEVTVMHAHARTHTHTDRDTERLRPTAIDRDVKDRGREGASAQAAHSAHFLRSVCLSVGRANTTTRPRRPSVPSHALETSAPSSANEPFRTAAAAPCFPPGAAPLTTRSPTR